MALRFASTELAIEFREGLRVRNIQGPHWDVVRWQYGQTVEVPQVQLIIGGRLPSW